MLAKRLFDIVAAALGLILLSPLLLLLAAWVHWDSPGPVLFRQVRIGRHGVPFTLLKFRSMHAGPVPECALSPRGDPRVTRAGRFLRASKLDELPQLWNVLRGEMSLVGPRPEVARYVAWYPAAARACVLSVAPGLTDWAAIRYRDEAGLLAASHDPEQVYREHILPIKLDYYQAYVRGRSFGGDLHILLATAYALLAGESRPASWRSSLIALLRGLAALEVAAAHLRLAVLPSLRGISDPPLWLSGLAFVTGFAHQAVVVFFVLSGWLVGGSLLDKRGQAQAYEKYAIDRLSRLWTVLLPALLFSALVCPPVAGQARDAFSLFGNLFGWQTLAVPVFAGNGPLWSLANESAYYVLFPLLLASATAASGGLRLLCAACAGLWIALAPPALSGYFLVWLAGVAGARLRWRLPMAGVWAAWLVFASLAVWLRLYGWNDDLDARALSQDLGYALLFALCLSLVPEERQAPGWLTRLATPLAAMSFSLYIVHTPLLQLMQPAPLDPHATASLLHFGQGLAVLLSGAALFYWLSEAHTLRVRAWLKRRLLDQRN